MGDALTPEQAEFFPTPAWCVRRFLEAVELPGGDWIEPCVGEGAIVRAVDRDDVAWTANDIRQVPWDDRYTALWHRDITRHGTTLYRWQVGITNPPFTKALPILRTLRPCCDNVALLLPLAWPSGHERFDFMREHKPDVFVLPDRPWEFVRDVAWFVWPTRGRGLEILPQTPLEERRRDAAAVETNRYRGPEQLGLLEVTG